MYFPEKLGLSGKKLAKIDKILKKPIVWSHDP